MVAIDDEDLEVPSAPLVYASVDNFVALTLDERGNLIRDSVQLTREPDPVNHADLSLVEPVNRGADRADFVELGAPMIEPSREVEREERLTFESVRALMRHKVQGGDGSPLGGGGSGRIAKKPRPVRLSRRNESDHRERTDAPRVRIWGLTEGEKDFFARRPNIARTVLGDLVGRIIRNEVVEPYVKVERLTFAFSVYFAPDEQHQVTILRQYRNAMRLALIEHARALDPARIAAIDRA